jgi:hypothetical protein
MSDRIFYQFTIKAYKNKVNMFVGSWFENIQLSFVNSCLCYIHLGLWVKISVHSNMAENMG